jgi:hypothetical protein
MWKKLVPIGSNIDSYSFYYTTHGYCSYLSNSCSIAEHEASYLFGHVGVIFGAAACIYPCFFHLSLPSDYLIHKYFIDIFLTSAASTPHYVVVFPLRVSLIYWNHVG